ncbi:3633_t:CDS:2 [Diversispora eburnea]|uniref:3633_t:CDS:1 n=1 Tax=Diversispora eburnea TaxID=1213867 RepID=A0A9N9F3Z0_9GLOM|nr:3633_t:CDS:2 [Diversispora eburnea]
MKYLQVFPLNSINLIIVYKSILLIVVITLENLNNITNWNTTTFTANANDLSAPLNDISSIQEYAFYLDPDDNYNAPQNGYTVTFNSLFNQLKDSKGIDIKKLIWGFDLSGIMKDESKSITGLMKNNDTCLKNSNFSIRPWKEIRNIALTDMCIANNGNGLSRYFDTDTNSTILSNS